VSNHIKVECVNKKKIEKETRQINKKFKIEYTKVKVKKIEFKKIKNIEFRKA